MAKVMIKEWVPDMAIVRDLVRGTSVTMENPKGSIWYCAFYDGRIVGFTCTVFSEKAARIKSLAVNKEYRGRGIGGLLMEHQIKVIYRRASMQKITAFASAWSQGLFLRHGFSLVKKIDRGNRETWYMELEIK